MSEVRGQCGPIITFHAAKDIDGQTNFFVKVDLLKEEKKTSRKSQNIIIYAEVSK